MTLSFDEFPRDDIAIENHLNLPLLFYKKKKGKKLTLVFYKKRGNSARELLMTLSFQHWWNRHCQHSMHDTKQGEGSKPMKPQIIRNHVYISRRRRGKDKRNDHICCWSWKCFRLLKEYQSKFSLAKLI